MEDRAKRRILAWSIGLDRGANRYNYLAIGLKMDY